MYERKMRNEKIKKKREKNDVGLYENVMNLCARVHVCVIFLTIH